MTIGSILLGLALLGLVALYVTRPLYTVDRHRRRRMSERKSLVLQKEAVLTEIQALDFDYETGKVAEEEYQEQREAYVQEAADLLMHIDALDEKYLEGHAVPAPDGGPAEQFDEIEAAIARRRAKAPTAATKATKKSAAPVYVETASTSQASDANFCPQCGKAADPGDRFCAYCGHQLAKAQHA
jgi:hypothetical protein